MKSQTQRKPTVAKFSLLRQLCNTRLRSSRVTLAFPNVAIAVETNHGGVIERLLERECCVFPVQTRGAKGYRQRKVPSGNKTDKVEA